MSRNGYGTTSTYTAVHQMLYKKRGRAADYPCFICEKPASDWAYEQSGGLPFGNLDDYVPLCRSCHWMADRGNFWCDKHECWTTATRYTERAGRPVQHRFCRECNREHGRRRSALIQEARALLGLSVKEYVAKYGQGRHTALAIIAQHHEEK